MVEFDDGLAVAMRGAVQARREDAVSLLQELVRVPSVTGEEGAVGAVVGRALSDLGLGLRGDVTVAATVGEENGGLGALSTVLRGYRADAAIITEPTRLALVPAQGGSLVFRLKIPGRSAHAAVRDEGVSALEKFVPIFENLRELEQERNGVLSHPLYDTVRNKVPINIGVVRAGNWASTVPESLVAEGRVGLIPDRLVRRGRLE